MPEALPRGPRLDPRQVHPAERELRQAAHEPAGIAVAVAREHDRALPAAAARAASSPSGAPAGASHTNRVAFAASSPRSSASVIAPYSSPASAVPSAATASSRCGGLAHGLGGRRSGTHLRGREVLAQPPRALRQPLRMREHDAHVLQRGPRLREQRVADRRARAHRRCARRARRGRGRRRPRSPTPRASSRSARARGRPRRRRPRRRPGGPSRAGRARRRRGTDGSLRSACSLNVPAGPRKPMRITRPPASRPGPRPRARRARPPAPRATAARPTPRLHLLDVEARLLAVVDRREDDAGLPLVEQRDRGGLPAGQLVVGVVAHDRAVRERAVEALLVDVEPALDARHDVDHPLVQRLELALDVGGVRDEIALAVAEDDALLTAAAARRAATARAAPRARSARGHRRRGPRSRRRRSDRPRCPQDRADDRRALERQLENRTVYVAWLLSVFFSPPTGSTRTVSVAAVPAAAPSAAGSRRPPRCRAASR